ncbi:histidine phosphatase family protein [Virgibacillus sp. M23]|uniref:histidine phosphatase family protein n=1 Tax=Virgibacillus sp. M23 TaxID=3079030 RepID=UPI002A908ABC|nr:histidine phosphatase family protein [Virgibacillus sp. M23]MDY7043147.1 histidine phosphatase family protein [Virgibacillus sp. M23]
MVTTIYLVRHAHSTSTPDEYNRTLSAQGVIAASQVTDKLTKENIHHVYSSPYRRAIQTIEGTARQLDKTIGLIENVKERILSDKPVKDFQTAITKVWGNYDFAFTGGESNYEAQHRGVKSIFELLEIHQNENIVIGTHGNIMVLIMNYFDRRYDFSFWEKLEMPAIYKLIFREKELQEIQKIDVD